MKQLTKISLAWELFEQQFPKSHIAKKLEVNRETVHHWLKGIQNHPFGHLRFWSSFCFHQH